MGTEFNQSEIGITPLPEASFVSNLRHWLGQQMVRFISSDSFIEAGAAMGSTASIGIMAQAEALRAKAAVAESTSGSGNVISLADQRRLRRLAHADGLKAQRLQTGQPPINAYRPWDDIETDKGDSDL